MDRVNFYIYNRGWKHVDWNKIYPNGRHVDFNGGAMPPVKSISEEAARKRRLYNIVILTATLAVPIYFILKR
jgi:hypothetical protein